MSEVKPKLKQNSTSNSKTTSATNSNYTTSATGSSVASWLPMMKVRRWSCSISFLLGIFFFLSCVILGTSIIVILFTLTNRTISSLFQDKQSLVLYSIERYAYTWLGQGKEIIETNVNYLHEVESDIDTEFQYNSSLGRESIDLMHRHMLRQIRNHKMISYIGYGNPEGTMIAVAPDKMNLRNMSNTYPDENTARTNFIGIFYTKLVDENYVEGEWAVNVLAKNYDYRANPNIEWYQCVLKDSVPRDAYMWSHFMVATGFLSSAIARKFYNKAGEFKGVLAVWFTLSNFQEFFNTFASYEGTLFIVDQRNGLLVATSSKHTIYSIDEDEVKHRSLAVDSDVPEIGETMRELVRLYGSVDKIPRIDSPKIVTGTGTRLVSIVPVNETGFTFAVVFVQNYFDVYGQIALGNGLSIGLSLGMIGVFVIVLVFLLYAQFKPLMKLINEMKKVELMQLDDVQIGKSFFFEIRMLQEKFQMTVDKLKEWRKFLPTSMLTKSRNLELGQGERDGKESQNLTASSDRSSIYSSGHASTESPKSFGSDTGSTPESGSLKSVFYNKFSKGLQMKDLCVVIIRFVNVFQIVESGMLEQFVDSYETFLTFLQQRILVGRVFKNAMHEFVLIFNHNAISYALAGLMEIRDTIQAIFSVAIFRQPLKFKILCDFDTFFQGILGNEKSMKHVIHSKNGDLYHNMLLKCADNNICVTKRAMMTLSEKARKCCVVLYADFFKIASSYVVFGYLVDYVFVSEEEWMYTLAKAGNQKVYDKIAKAFKKIRRNNFEAALELLIQDKAKDAKFLQFDKDGEDKRGKLLKEKKESLGKMSKIREFCSLMKEKRWKMEDLMGKAQDGTSLTAGLMQMDNEIVWVVK